MTNVSIIGAGKLGTSLGYALSKKGFRIKALSCRTLSSAKQSSLIIGDVIASTDNIQTSSYGDLIILSVPDDKIEEVATQLALSDLKWSKKLVFHCSGLMTVQTLKPLKDKGALTASLHPIQSFAQKSPDASAFEGIYFGLEGSKEALEVLKRIVRALGSQPLIIEPADKPLYHAACSVASNFLVVLLDSAVFLFKQLGIPEDHALRSLLPLTQGTLHNVKKLKTRVSLTGPIVRGDQQSIQAHLKALEDFPYCYEMYLKLAAQALEIAKKGKQLPQQKIRALKTLLGEK